MGYNNDSTVFMFYRIILNYIKILTLLFTLLEKNNS
jgi:hypothetical protein